MRFAHRLVPLAAAVSIVLAGCSGEDADDDHAATEHARPRTSSSAPTSAAESTASPSPSEAPESTSAAATSTAALTTGAKPKQECASWGMDDEIEDLPVMSTPASVVLGGAPLTGPAYTEVRCGYSIMGVYDYAAGDTSQGFTISRDSVKIVRVSVYANGVAYRNFDLTAVSVATDDNQRVVTGTLYDPSYSPVAVEIVVPL